MKEPTLSEPISERMHMIYNHDLEEVFNKTINSTRYRLYNYFMRFFINYIQNLNLPKAKVLDIGAAQSNFSLLLAEAGYDVTAIDIQPEFIEYSKLKYERGKIDFLTGNFAEMLIDKKFDIILLGEILEHTNKPNEILDKCINLMHEQSFLIITTPSQIYFRNKLPDFTSVKKLKNAKKFFPDGNDHYFLYRPSELLEIFSNKGLKVVDSRFYRSLYLNGDVKLRYLHKLIPEIIHYKIEKTIENFFSQRYNKIFSQQFYCLKLKDS